MSLFQNVVSQYIDQNGKVQMLNYENGVSLMVSPLPPLDVPIDKSVNESNRKVALKFIRKHNLEIISQDGDPDEEIIQGLWVQPKLSNSGIEYGYIPVKNSAAIHKVSYTSAERSDPIRVENTSDMEIMIHHRRVAHVLKEYVQYEYSLDPNNFSENNFIVRREWVYDLDKLNKKLFKNKNDVMYSQGKLIVNSKNIRDALISFLKVQTQNDEKTVLSYSRKKYIPGYFNSLGDFDASEDQYIFTSKTSLLKWRSNALNENKGKIMSVVNENTRAPYFYKNYNILGGKMLLIQNVEGGTLENALLVCDKWSKDKINPGYIPKLNTTEMLNIPKYLVYTTGGLDEEESTAKKSVYRVLKNADKYSAILTL